MSQPHVVWTRRTWVRAAAVAALVAMAVVGVWWAVARGGVSDGAAATPSPSASSPVADASTAATPSASTSPSAEETVADPDAVAPPAPPADGAAAPGPDGRPTLAPVAIDAAVQPAAGVTARVAQVEDVVGEAVLPGEVGGPAVRVHVEVVNGTTAPLDLSVALLNAYTGPDLAPATELSAPGPVPFPASVAPGGTAKAAFVLRMDPAERSQVRLELDLGGAAAVALFDGAL